jgi:hypothetical protein
MEEGRQVYGPHRVSSLSPGDGDLVADGDADRVLSVNAEPLFSWRDP